ncbi:MAG: DHH family phosphoesterase [Amoebophilaceae bacterium]|nr:DHH family phosphoesterase [Amoebophilaceae bacterium]
MDHNISILKKQLNHPKRIVIITHVKPDGDALGTSLALAFFLKQQGHVVQVVIPTEHPNFLSWLPGADAVINREDFTEETLLEQVGRIDLLFCVDCSTVKRLGQLKFLVERSDLFKVIIDHHIEPEDFADLLFWNVKAAASAEILFSLFEALGQVDSMHLDMATCLYVGLITDTNSFKNSNTTPKTHYIAAKLIACGVDIVTTHRLIYDNKSLNRLHFFSFAISQRLVVLPEFHAAYFVIQKEDYKRYDLQMGDTEGLVDYALTLRGILLGAVLKEKDDAIDLSLRSVGDIPANLIAKKYFHGGGHRNAAGGFSKLSLTETVDLFEKILKNTELQH